jgi:hypothetical protein
MTRAPDPVDHLLLGVPDLHAGRRLGSRSARACVRRHPGRGTRNALLGLAKQRYFEIDPGSPDPDSSRVPVVKPSGS